MSSLNKIKKNAERYRMDEIYRNMTPEQYREGIRLAVKNATEALAKEYDKNLEKVQERAKIEIKESVRAAIDMLSVELLYELGNQLGCFEENAEYLDEKIEKVQDIYKNTMQAIENYTTIKKQNQAHKNFYKRKEKVEKMFKIKF